jgi:predicted phosphodiesterase
MTSYDRYAGKVVARLAEGADLITRHTSADLVVFGHAHHAEVRGTYANPGSFAFSPGEGRTFLEIDTRGDRPRADLRSIPKGA